MIQSTLSVLRSVFLTPTKFCFQYGLLVPTRHATYYTTLPLRHLALSLYSFWLFLFDLTRSLEVRAYDASNGAITEASRHNKHFGPH